MSSDVVGLDAKILNVTELDICEPDDAKLVVDEANVGKYFFNEQWFILQDDMICFNGFVVKLLR